MSMPTSPTNGRWRQITTLGQISEIIRSVTDARGELRLEFYLPKEGYLQAKLTDTRR